MATFGSSKLEYPGAGPLGCLTMAFVAALRWRKETRSGQEVSSFTLIEYSSKQLANDLIRLRACAGWSEALLVAHTTLLETSCRGSYISNKHSCCLHLVWWLHLAAANWSLLGLGYLVAWQWLLWLLWDEEKKRGLRKKGLSYTVVLLCILAFRSHWYNNTCLKRSLI